MNPSWSVITHRIMIKLCWGIHAPHLLYHPPFPIKPHPLLYGLTCTLYMSLYGHIFIPSKEWLWSCIPFSFNEQPTSFSLWYSLPTLFLNVPQCSVCLSLPHFSTKHSSSLSQALVSLFLTHTYGKNYRHDSDWGSCPWQLLIATMKTESAENACVSCIYASVRVS